MVILNQSRTCLAYVNRDAQITLIKRDPSMGIGDTEYVLTLEDVPDVTLGKYSTKERAMQVLIKIGMSPRKKYVNEGGGSYSEHESLFVMPEDKA